MCGGSVLDLEPELELGSENSLSSEDRLLGVGGVKGCDEVEGEGDGGSEAYMGFWEVR